MADFAEARRTMVDRQLRTVDVTDRAVLAAFGEVPREAFLPGRRRQLAYSDAEIALREPIVGTDPGRYALPPPNLARLVQLLAVTPADIALAVGCGTGYSAAILARLAASVVAVEGDRDMAATATSVLMDLDIGNVAVVAGPPEAGYPADAPYDAILVEGAVEEVPATLLRQLKDGGRLVAVVGHGLAAMATVYTRAGNDVAGRPAFNLPAPPLPGFARPRAFTF